MSPGARMRSSRSWTKHWKQLQVDGLAPLEDQTRYDEDAEEEERYQRRAPLQGIIRTASHASVEAEATLSASLRGSVVRGGRREGQNRSSACSRSVWRG